MTHRDKLIIITGASGGIGKGVVAHLLELGYTRLVCQYKSQPEELRDLFTLRRLPPWLHCIQADLTKPEDVEVLFSEMAQTHKVKPWGLINLAGASTNAMSWKLSLDAFKEIVDVNLTSTFLMCKRIIPDMRTQEGGRILNVSSVVASTGAVGAAHYCAAKAGIEGFSRAIALELANKNITVNTLALGYFEAGLIEHLSPQLQDNVRQATPLKRFGRCTELASLIDFMMSDNSAFITGQQLHINGGFKL